MAPQLLDQAARESGQEKEMERREVETTRLALDPNDPSMEGRVVNSMVDSLTMDHVRLAEPLSRMTRAASALASSPDDLRLRAEAIDAWTVLKSDLWHHLRQENSLLFSWAGPHPDVPNHLIAAQRRDQRKIRSLVEKIGEQRFLKAGEWDIKPSASALSDLANLLEAHIERDEEALFPSIRQAALELVSTRH